MPVTSPPVAPATKGRPSDAWAKAVLSDNWRLVITATLWSSPSPGPQTQLSPTPLLISDGSLTIDRANSVRRSGTLVIADPLGSAGLAWLATSLSSPLAPNGNEIHLSAQAVAPAPGGGFFTTDAISLGAFAITTAVMNDTGSDLTMTVELFDRSWVIAERVFGPGGFTLPTSYSLYQLIASVVENRYPGMPRSISDANATATPISTFAEGDNPWQKVTDALAQSALGYELFFDRNGVLTGYTTPDPSMATPVWNFTEGSTETATEIQRTLTRVSIANDFIRSSTGTDTNVVANGPFRGEVQDSNPASPTWVGGSFGQIYNFATSAFITNEATAEATARNDLRTSLGQTDTIQITALPLPFLDIDDVVTVTRSRLGLTNANYVIDSITLPFRFDGKMQLVGRRVFSS